MSAWMDIAQAAAYANVNRRTLYRAVRNGELQAAKINARGDLRCSVDWICQWMERCSVRGAKPASTRSTEAA